MDNTRGKLSIKRFVCCLSTTILLIICFTVACDREAEPSGNSSNASSAVTGEMITVKFTVTDLSFLRSGLDSPPKGALGEACFLPSGELEEAFFIHATLSESNDPVSLRSMTLGAGTKIRVVAYTISAGDTVIVDFADYEIIGGGDNFLIPTSAPILLPSGSYKFVAYSYSDANTMPAIADTTVAIPSTDLIWGQTDENINPGNTTVHIQMEHLFSQIMLNAVVDPLLGNTINGIDVARFEHAFPSLVVRSKNLIPNPTNGLIDFEWPAGASFTNIWNSISHPVFTNGGPPVLTIDSVTIDATTYYGPFHVAYSASLDPGKEYTLNVTFVPQSLTVSTDKLIFAKCDSGSGVEQVVTVSTNVPSGWTFSVGGAHASEFTVIQSGNTLTVYPNINPCCAPRTATITITAGILTETVTLTQDATTRIDYKGYDQLFHATCSGTYQIELWGASDGSSSASGGYTKGEIYLGAGVDLFIYVGGRGNKGTGPAPGSNNILAGGYNGGGNAFGFHDGNNGSGGGATDIRYDGTALVNRIMVAGGGGGWVSAGNLIPGAGGGLSGSNCVITYSGVTYTSYGGTQIAGGTTGGSFGQGGNGGTASVNAGHNYQTMTLSHRAGGGGGYYGGGHSVLTGGGGSSFISGHNGCNSVNSSGNPTGQPNHFSGLIFTNTVMIDGTGRGWTNVVGGITPMPNPDGGFYPSGTGHNGDGFVIITYLGP